MVPWLSLGVAAEWTRIANEPLPKRDRQATRSRLVAEPARQRVAIRPVAAVFQTAAGQKEHSVWCRMICVQGLTRAVSRFVDLHRAGPTSSILLSPS